MSLALANLSRGAFAEVIEHALAAAALGTRPDGSLGVAALAATYAGDLHQARELNNRMRAVAVSPTLRAFSAYVAGEIDNAAGHRDRTEEQYAQAIHLARSSGATFVNGIASVGLLTVRADAGRVHDALRGYRDVIDYFARTGNWTHQWVTLRNLAHLLRQLDDYDAGEQLDAAADHAPDAPAASAISSTGTARRILRQHPALSRAHAVAVARQAIERNLVSP
ncbi:MAG: hypothetical protein M3143_01595 [Actinomycetota bacterium]|nr:hypothetical protein [Actinomycetota bacterium]